MAVQTTSCQQPIEIREMSRGMEQYFQGLSRRLIDSGSLVQYLLIGYYYNKIPRYSLLEYLRNFLKSSWLTTVTNLAKLVAEEKVFTINDGNKNIYIPYSVLAEEILMILDIINAYEHKAGVTIDEVTTVNQFDSYYSDFTKFISQYTNPSNSGLRTKKSADSKTVINRFIELGLIDDSYKKQKSPQKKEISIEEKEEISMEEEISSSEESIEEPQTLDVNENGENEQKPLIEMLANDVKKVIKKAGKSSKHTRTTNKREEEKDKKKRNKEKRIEKKEKAKKEAGAGDYVFDRTKGFIHAVIEDMSKETEKQREIQGLIANVEQQLHTVFTNIIPALQALAAKGFNIHIPTKEEFEGVGDRFVWLPPIPDGNLHVLEGTGYKFAINNATTPRGCWLDTEIIGANDSKGKKLYYKFAEL